MSFRDKIKINKVGTDFRDYMYVVNGKSKSGKTSLVFNVCKQLTGRPDSVLILSIGNETGTEVLPNAATAEIETWADFEDAIDFFVEEEHNFRFISIDTINELVKLAQDEVERIHYKETGDLKSVDAAWGGYQRGHKKAQRMIDNIITKLKRSPYGLFVVGHLKVKQSKVLLGEGHDVVTSDLRSDYYGVFEKKATVIASIIVEPIENNGVIENVRNIYFRTTDKVESGSRIETLPISINYDIDLFISTIKEALDELNNGDGFNSKEYDSAQMTAQNTLENKEDFKDEIKKEQELSEVIDEIKQTTMDVQEQLDDANKSIMKVLKDNGVKDPTKIEDKELAEKVLNDLKELL